MDHTAQSDLPWATSDDWMKHREEICRLYKDHTLEYVMAEVEKRYRFKGKPKWYKDRFAKWGVTKNRPRKRSPSKSHTSSPRVVAVRSSSIARSRSLASAGSPSVAETPESTKDLPSALTLRDETTMSGIQQFSVVSVLAFPTPPDVYSIPEQVFYSVSNYVQRSKPIAEYYENPIADGILEDYSNHVKNAAKLFRARNTEEAGWQLALAAGLAEDVVRQDLPSTLETVYRSLIRIFEAGMPDIASQICANFYDVYSICGCESPLARMFFYLHLVQQEMLHTVISQCYRLWLDQLETHNDPLDKRLIPLRENWFTFRGPGEVSLQSLQLLEQRLSACQDRYGLYSEEVLTMKLSMIWIYRHQGRYPAAITYGLEMLEHLEESAMFKQTATEMGLNLDIVLLKSLAESYYKSRQKGWAEFYLRQYLAKRPTDYMKMNLVLQRWLKKWGRPQEANDLEASRKELSKSLAARLPIRLAISR